MLVYTAIYFKSNGLYLSENDFNGYIENNHIANLNVTDDKCRKSGVLVKNFKKHRFNSYCNHFRIEKC